MVKFDYLHASVQLEETMRKGQNAPSHPVLTSSISSPKNISQKSNTKYACKLMLVKGYTINIFNALVRM